MEKRLSYFQMFVAAIIFGGMVFSGKLFEQMGVSVVEISLIPSIFLSVGLLLYLREKIFNVSKLGKKYIFLYCVLAAAQCFATFMPLYLGVSVSLTILLLYTQPVWTAFISHFVLKRGTRLFEIVSLILVLIGVVCLVGLSDLSGSLLGVLLALFAGLTLALEGFIVEKLSKNDVDANVSYFWMFLFSVFVFSFMGFYFMGNAKYPEFGLNLFSFDRLDMFLYLALFSFLFCWLGNYLMYKAYKNVSALHGGLILLLEPVGGVLLDVTILKTPLTDNIVVGGIFILVGNMYLAYKENKE
ncbi:MAG: DMT family transporter [Alphaproteobacteria bacterium]|jgi:drug/metabolite transporter (DMT)-like permease|nr:DMT family transporter [Alphaproteobacteria bacterium]